MLFKEFVLHNFGIYRGRHAVDLEPENGRPIVLFGALNGSGKTTFLDGLQLALYGKHARCTSRGNMAYPDFLKSCINRYVSPGEGAGLELEFGHQHEGTWQTIRVYRTWRGRGEGVREKLEIYRNGTLDSVLSERWSEFVEDFIPSQISELFFFDGEKIEALAEESSAAAIIRTGVHALLGLEVVDRLSADLKVLQRRRRTEELDQEGQARLAIKQRELDTLSQQKSNLARVETDQLEKLKAVEAQAKAAREHYRQQGGELAQRAVQIEADAQRLRADRRQQDGHLQELAGGAAPLLLVQDLLRSARTQATREHETRRAKELLGEFEARDNTVLDTLRRAATPDEALQLVSEQLVQDRQRRVEKANRVVYLNLPMEGLSLFTDESFDEVRANITAELTRARELSEQVDHCERTLAGMPNPETLSPLAQNVSTLEEAYQRAAGGLAIIEQQKAELVRNYERVEREWQSLMTHEAQLVFKSETNKRVLEHSVKVENTLRRYREAILARNLERLSLLILQSFQSISRKKNMFTRIDISPINYRLSLFDAEGNEVPSYQLSAGERQLLAVSILWGLSRAAGRPLPAIIDTPLGRLDGEHRVKLVNSYFPSASHQVILLSTDQEIDDTLYPQLSHAISKEYLIEFNEGKLSSEIRAGYFDFAEAVQ